MKRLILFLSLLLLPLLAACSNGGASNSGRSSPTSASTAVGNGSVVQEELTVTSPNGQLWGEVFRPDDNDQHLILIYSHGLGSSYRYGEDYGQALAKQGYVVYTFGFYGDNSSGRSGS